LSILKEFKGPEKVLDSKDAIDTRCHGTRPHQVQDVVHIPSVSVRVFPRPPTPQRSDHVDFLDE
jgi:hypothetical protein